MTEQVGPLGEEAVKLLAAAQDWFHRNLGDATTARIATDGPSCVWCPVCQLISLLRGDLDGLGGGVVPERVSEVQTAFAGLLRAVADAVGGGPSGSGRSDGGASARGASSSSARPPRVQRIDLDSED